MLVTLLLYLRVKRETEIEKGGGLLKQIGKLAERVVALSKASHTLSLGALFIGGIFCYTEFWIEMHTILKKYCRRLIHFFIF